MYLYYFKAAKNTKRFRQNQKVWIRSARGNHLIIRFKYKGCSRYVNGVIDLYSSVIDSFKKIEVEDSFFKRIKGDYSNADDSITLENRGFNIS